MINSRVSHTGSVQLTGMAVETTFTGDMKQQHSHSNCDGAGLVVSLYYTDQIKYGEGRK